MTDFLTPEEWQAVRLSLQVGLVAVAASLPLGIALGWLLARKDFRGKMLVEIVLNLPLVMPPVVTGYLLLMAFGARGFLGRHLEAWLGLRLVFDWKGAALASAVVAFPIAHFAARYARGRWKALFYLGVMLPLWSSYLVKIYAWKLILAKEGILGWLFDELRLGWLLEAWLALPVVGGNSLSLSATGTFIVFVYVWLPFMILPLQASLERVPANLVEASADLGATPLQTFRKVIFPLALPGLVAGSIFTFSLTLGDYIIPQIIGTSRLFIGQAVYAHQGTAGNIPLAAAFTVVPIAVMGLYLWGARKMGAFDAL